MYSTAYRGKREAHDGRREFFVVFADLKLQCRNCSDNFFQRFFRQSEVLITDSFFSTFEVLAGMISGGNKHPFIASDICAMRTSETLPESDDMTVVFAVKADGQVGIWKQVIGHAQISLFGKILVDKELLSMSFSC